MKCEQHTIPNIGKYWIHKTSDFNVQTTFRKAPIHKSSISNGLYKLLISYRMWWIHVPLAAFFFSSFLNARKTRTCENWINAAVRFTLKMELYIKLCAPLLHLQPRRRCLCFFVIFAILYGASVCVCVPLLANMWVNPRLKISLSQTSKIKHGPMQPISGLSNLTHLILKKL